MKVRGAPPPILLKKVFDYRLLSDRVNQAVTREIRNMFTEFPPVCIFDATRRFNTSMTRFIRLHVRPPRRHDDDSNKRMILETTYEYVRETRRA